MIRITYKTRDGGMVSAMYQRTIERVAIQVIERLGHTIIRIEQIGASA